MSLTPLDIHNRIKQSEFYDRGRDIETALVWNVLKKLLTLANKESHFSHIKSIKISKKSITIMTGKPLINRDLNYLLSPLSTEIKELIKKDLRIFFK